MSRRLPINREKEEKTVQVHDKRRIQHQEGRHAQYKYLNFKASRAKQPPNIKPRHRPHRLRITLITLPQHNREPPTDFHGIQQLLCLWEPGVFLQDTDPTKKNETNDENERNESRNKTQDVRGYVE